MKFIQNIVFLFPLLVLVIVFTRISKGNKKEQEKPDVAIHTFQIKPAFYSWCRDDTVCSIQDSVDCYLFLNIKGGYVNMELLGGQKIVRIPVEEFGALYQRVGVTCTDEDAYY